jgi:hypothetical protein
MAPNWLASGWRLLRAHSLLTLAALGQGTAMSANGMRAEEASKEADFVLSHAGATEDDKRLARWIHDLLARHHRKVLLGTPGQTRGPNSRVIALLSAPYMHDEPCVAVAKEALGQSSQDGRTRLILLRTERVRAKGPLAGVPFTDLVPFLDPRDEAALERVILEAIGAPSAGPMVHPPVEPVRPGPIARRRRWWWPWR